jgi:Delta3-Delta2-enoyl-CoA isomerase
MSDEKEGIKDIKFTGLEVETQGKLMIIRFTVPKRRNAITTTMYNGLSHYLKSAASDSGITIVALTGTGAFYSSGNDFGQLFSQSVSDDSSEDMATRGMNLVRYCFTCK